jgi:paraquat-inducible protein A
MSAGYVTARSEGLINCRICGLLCPMLPEPGSCPRCGSRLHSRTPRSLERASALLLAAAILYVPANVLPVLHTASEGSERADTIFSGILALWSGDSWPLAMLVFAASILVPALKFIILGFLIFTTKQRSHWALYDRALLYRIIEFIGRWSMLDVYVVTLMVALVRFSGLATIEPGIGALAFAAVVVLMMHAVQSFDPRLMWEQSRNG